jgi:hypothetical protein
MVSLLKETNQASDAMLITMMLWKGKKSHLDRN